MEQELEVKNYKTRIIIGLFLSFIIMAIAYIPLAYKAKFGVVGSTKDWDIKSSVVRTTNITGGASEKYKPYTVGNTVYFGVVLRYPGDYIVYEIEVENAGRLDSRLDDILVNVGNENNEDNAIKYTVSNIERNDIIKAGEKKVINIKVEWDPSVQKHIDSAYSTLAVNLQFVQN